MQVKDEKEDADNEDWNDTSKSSLQNCLTAIS